MADATRSLHKGKGTHAAGVIRSRGVKKGKINYIVCGVNCIEQWGEILTRGLSQERTLRWASIVLKLTSLAAA
jgi:hypothetical protein